MRRTIKVADLRKLLSYEPATGVLTWKERPEMSNQWNARYAGAYAGTKSTSRGCTYCTIAIDGKKFYAHILAFVLVTGRMPQGLIDHIDGDGTNNKWLNLREASISQNLANSIKRTSARRGLKGAYYDRRRGKWLSSISINGRTFNLGRFDTEQAAHTAYCAKAKEQFGEFARVA